jgi:membrane protease YdiL (CAAX protease family)
MGAYLGWLYVGSGNLLVPILVHALYDFVALAFVVSDRGFLQWV